jgi:cysteine-rich repeat protein
VIPWAEAEKTVLDAYRAFSPELADVGQKFFGTGWIDAPARPGKSPGAFAHPTVPSAHPYLLLNYQGKVRDVMTLAHEAPGCKPPATCGDGLIDAAYGEQCDDGSNDGSYNGCNADCTLGPRCGDGVLDEIEGCDDGNRRNNDGCNVNCRVEVRAEAR